jgi:hypothetical protein
MSTPNGRLPTFTVAVTVLVVVSITETLLLPSLVIYAYGPIAVEFSMVDAKAVEELRIKSKTIYIEAKAIEYNFCLFFIYFFPLIFLLLKNSKYYNVIKIFKHFVKFRIVPKFLNSGNKNFPNFPKG